MESVFNDATLSQGVPRATRIWKRLLSLEALGDRDPGKPQLQTCGLQSQEATVSELKAM